MAIYNKPFLSIADQLTLMKNRGIAVTDDPRAQSCVDRIGYYRLSGYSYPFRRFSQTKDPITGRIVTVAEDDFLPGTNFSTIMDLYIFDKKLRLLMLDAIERVEVALRVAIAHMLGKRDPEAHLNPAQLHGGFTKKLNWKGTTGHADWLGRYRECVRRSHEEFVSHFKKKYPNCELPIWMAIEVWDFGLMSMFLQGMKNSDQLALAQSFGLTREDLIVSWVRAINNVRNACAHHSRIWNAPVVDYPKPTKPGEIAYFNHIVGDTNAQTRLYYVVCILRFMLLKINPTTTWPERLKAHLATLPQGHSISLRRMGFPANWEAEKLWL